MRAAAGEGSGGLGKPPQPAYPRGSALRLDGVPGKYPVVPLKIGVFQELRDNILTGQPYRAWMVHRPSKSCDVAARPHQDLTGNGENGLHRYSGHYPKRQAWFSDVVLPEASYLERYDPVYRWETKYSFVSL